jgi:hypothetical protein
MSKIAQSAILFGICVVIAISLNLFYMFVAVMVATLAMTTGLAILIALMAGFAWPMIAIAYVLFVTGKSPLAKALGLPTTSEPGLTGVEDPKHRKN